MLHTRSRALVCVCTHVCIIGVWRRNTLHMQSSLYMRQQARLIGEEAAHKYDNRLLKEHGFQALAALLRVGWNLSFVWFFFFLFQLAFKLTYVTKAPQKPTRTSGLLQMKSPYSEDLSQHSSDSHGSAHCSGPSIKTAWCAVKSKGNGIMIESYVFTGGHSLLWEGLAAGCVMISHLWQCCSP